MTDPKTEAPGEVLQTTQAHKDQGTDDDSVAKQFRTWQARYALRSVQLQRLSSGEYLAHSWNLCRFLPDLRAVAEFGRRIGA